MTISAQMVKELRERTGLGMMECKAALTEANGDMDAAADILRKKAGAKLEKKSGRTAADGAIAIHTASDGKTAGIVEINSETDFVAKGDDFLDFAGKVAARVATSNPSDIEALLKMPADDGKITTIAQSLEALVAKLGEKMGVRRFERWSSAAAIGSYVHGRKIGVLVELKGGDAELAKDIAMHVAASRPECVSKEQVPAERIAKEKEIFVEQAQQSGKPANIIEKMVEGRINKFLNEISLLGQPFVKDPDTTVEKLLKSKGAQVLRFVRYEVGEGIEKKASDFAAEVMATVKGG